MKQVKLSVILFFISLFVAMAQDTVHFVGAEKVNIDYHHGQLSPVLGVHNIQVMRANRELPETADGLGWTYNHAANLAYWNNKFYYHYLNDPVGEHIPPGRTMLLTSEDGYNWTKPITLFPEYRIPNGTTKEGVDGVAKKLDAVMHQRMGFYVAKDGRLLTLAYYAICLNKKDSPNDGKGIGRAVREIYKDGTFGPIYFIRYNHGWNEENTDFPFYKSSKDKGFVAACDELMANALQMQQWVEEADRDDPLIPIKKQYKAFSYYHLPNGNVMGLWKHALTACSTDEGKTWTVPLRAPGFVNANAKIWGQRTNDGKYVTVYNPSEFRWPLALSISNDGVEYDKLLLVNGEITTMRYGGNYKSYGPQYVRGIVEGNGVPADKNLWVAYSMNKEDMWISRVKVPVLDKETEQVDEVFSEMEKGKELDRWNIFSPVWAPVKIEEQGGQRWLALRDKDEFDYAKATRLFPSTDKPNVEFTIKTGQNNTGLLHVELQDEKNTPAIRLIFDKDGVIKYKSGYRVNRMHEYEAGKEYTIRIEATATDRFYKVFLNGEQVLRRLMFAPVKQLDKIVFRTGEIRRFPNADTPTDQDFDVKQSGKPVQEAAFFIKSLKTEKANGEAAVLKADDFKHYVDYFNGMEDENIVQAIPNAESWDWMKANVPLFECPQHNFEQMFYYRWWTLRKHIKETPVGYAMTEFLVERSYSDKYNLIACAIGHHTMESRWLHNSKYLDEYLHVWYRGNEGKPMERLRKFSSWTPAALLEKYNVDGNHNYLLDLLPDMEANYKRWEQERRLPNGLFWQEDVKDGMEEQISGGRRVKNARPTINSYMQANAVAIAKMAELQGDTALQQLYLAKADTLKNLIQTKLWNPEMNFYETIREKTQDYAGVREAIGYIPWYFNIPGNEQTVAWEQITDEEGFLCPYGMTTAERRHPEFRTHGCCKCEWDGAIWPFATSQTLVGLANLLNNYNQDLMNDSIYFKHLELYVESQYHRGRPYIGEYQDEVTGYWLKGDQERSRYYNHSTFNDLIITGLCGLRPRGDNKLEVNPLIPEDKWDWFCLDKVKYHGKMVSIVWDKNGDKYQLGKGLTILVDGKVVGNSEKLEKIVCELTASKNAPGKTDKN
ncbi:glycosyl hydrolase family 65 protein [uncultured Draconibacterium sp.]|uniref:MGH1-like glycoside hydrolase domain-containing protein n=1 Tax=uncultured Draconibacterium sp. TaxID=1573823 RepID=UPI0025D45628|nr:glycosyl hydrolase family 65 protein [uncultured Draconibacterium sp.]